MTQNTVFQWIKNYFLLSNPKFVFFTEFNLVIINIKSYFTYEAEATDGGQEHPLQPEAGVADGHEDWGGAVSPGHILNLDIQR